MAKKSSFDITCPCCGALMKIDPETQAIISHTAPVKPKTYNDMEEAATPSSVSPSKPRSTLPICWRKNSRRPSAKPKKLPTPDAPSATSIWIEKAWV
jgi:hypothetical protein